MSKSPLNKALAASLIGICAVVSLPAHAWGYEGHEIVADVAQAYLTPQAWQRVDALLAVEPGATLASISTWADKHRSPTTSKWHYVNFDRNGDCTYRPKVNCPRGRCVVAALNKEIHRLTASRTQQGRFKALRYVVHLVGDAHQPLHAGFGDDRGGNSYQVHAFGRGTNLHALWDTKMIQQIDRNPSDYAARLVAAANGQPPVTDTNPVAWVESGCRIDHEAGFYPPHKLPADYLSHWTPVLDQRLLQGGQHLAAVLNQALQ